MRGLRIAGGFLALMAVLSLAVPVSVKAQGATPQQYFAAGNQYYAAKDYAKAYQYYYAAVKLNPNYAQAYQGVGNCFYAMGRKADALTFYQRASALQPANTQLAQFVQGLAAQVNTGGAAPGAGVGMAADPLSQGTALLKQGQYASSLAYFQQAIQQNPNDYKGYYYAGYAYAYMRDSKDSALYFEVAAAKSQNASIKSYADRIKASLAPDDQQWVDDQASKYSQGMAVAGGGKKEETAFGFHVIGGTEYVFADPNQIKTAAIASQSVSISGVTPSFVAVAGIEPYIRLGQNFEINLGLSFLPIGNLSYAWANLAPAVGSPLYYKDTYNLNAITASLGFRVNFGDNAVRGYFAAAGDLSPTSLTFTKIPYDATFTTPGLQDPSTGNYSTLAFGGHAKLGVDFYLGKSVALGPFVGFQYLSASNFKNAGGAGLLVEQDPAPQGNGGYVSTGKVGANPMVAPSALTLDFSGIDTGVNLTFSF